MLVLSIIELTFTTMSPRIISSAARLKACSFNLVIPKIRSSSILIFYAIFARQGTSPQYQYCYLDLVISLPLSGESAIFRDEIENYFSCSRLARRDRDYHMTILIFWDENEIPFCYSHVSRRDRDFRKSFLVVEREKMKLTLVENSRDREFSLTSEMAQNKEIESEKYRN